jgi:hypothetical protein
MKTLENELTTQDAEGSDSVQRIVRPYNTVCLDPEASPLERENAKMESEINHLRKIEDASKALWKAKGRYNSQLAMCKLGELLGETVHWPNTKNMPPAGLA